MDALVRARTTSFAHPLPPAHHTLVCEFALAPLLDALETMTGRETALRSVDPESDPPPALDCVSARVTVDDMSFDVSVPASATTLLEAWPRETAPLTPDTVTLSLRMGGVRLPVTELASARPGDMLLANVRPLSRSEGVLWIGHRHCADVGYTSRRVIIKQEVRFVSDDPESSAAPAPAPAPRSDPKRRAPAPAAKATPGDGKPPRAAPAQSAAPPSAPAKSAAPAAAPPQGQAPTPSPAQGKQRRAAQVEGAAAPPAGGGAARKAPPPPDAADATDGAASKEDAVAMFDAGDVMVEVSFEVARLQKSLRDISDLKSGSILNFDKKLDDNLKIIVDGRFFGYGRLIEIGKNLGVQITKIGKRDG
ncbi:MAG: FliM/FliN family flagellar motor switch protein [Pseudomonadota bacterium]